MALHLWSRGATTRRILQGTFKQSSHVLAMAQQDELVLLDMRRERYFTLNAVGSRAWTLLANGATCATLVKVICHEYDVRSAADEEVVRKDIARLLSELHAAGLVSADTHMTSRQP